MLMFYNDQITNVTFVGKRMRYIVNTYSNLRTLVYLRSFEMNCQQAYERFYLEWMRGTYAHKTMSSLPPTHFAKGI